MAGIVEQLKTHGYSITRYNLGQEPIKFAENALVKRLLESKGNSALPMIMIDGSIEFSGSYPSKETSIKHLSPIMYSS